MPHESAMLYRLRHLESLDTHRCSISGGRQGGGGEPDPPTTDRSVVAYRCVLLRLRSIGSSAFHILTPPAIVQFSLWQRGKISIRSRTVRGAKGRGFGPGDALPVSRSAVEVFRNHSWGQQDLQRRDVCVQLVISSVVRDHSSNWTKSVRTQ